MTQRGKYFVYAIGFLVGCALVWGLFWKKEGMDLAPRGERELKAWKGRVFFEKTEPVAEDSNVPATHFKRVRVVDDGSGKMVRVEEIFEKSKKTKNHERVMDRKVMASNVVRVRFRNVDMAVDGELWLKEHGLKFEVLSNVLVRVFFEVKVGHDGVGEMIAEMNSHPDWVEVAFPEYILYYG